MEYKIATYNVNGLRSAIEKGFLDWLKDSFIDIICLQEIKAEYLQLPIDKFKELGYNCYVYSAQKKGYSGVAILTKHEPKHVEYGIGIDKYDTEGRVIRLDFDNFSVISVYMPSGSSGEERQDFKFTWMNDFYNYTQSLLTFFPKLIISGDYNICHEPIDIHNPKSNANSSGFLIEERDWLSKFIKLGFIDSFRYLNKSPHNYTWWSYRAGARKKNLGWRIDYNMVSTELEQSIKSVEIEPNVVHSDHCPSSVTIEI